MVPRPGVGMSVEQERQFVCLERKIHPEIYNNGVL